MDGTGYVLRKGNMKVKDLIKLFSSNTQYEIKDATNPHYTIWWGQGNKVNTIYNDDEIKGITWHKKGIIIYI